MKNQILSIPFLFASFFCFAQFPPGANVDGTTAIPADSPLIQSWANNGSLERGLMQIDNPDLGLAGVGVLEDAFGMADGSCVSLGDGGFVTYEFDMPIRNGDGWDFVVFENGFPVGEEYFLELAFVEVSSDGQNFVRFPATSLTDTTMSIGAFGTLDPTKLNNLAGKYEGGFGVPFDLEELATEPNLDVEQITHVRIIDVVGSLDDGLASFDTDGNKINDPFPTPFPSSGFDLDAIGVIHQQMNTSTFVEDKDAMVKVFPNPITDSQNLHLHWENINVENVVLYNAIGEIIVSISVDSNNLEIPILSVTPGMYFIQFKAQNLCISRPFLVN